MSKFGSITIPQRAMLALLDDGPEEDSVGLEAETLKPSQIAVCERLTGRALVRFDIGWRHSCWFRLTPAGREALDLLRSAQSTVGRRRGTRKSAAGASMTSRETSNPTRTITHGQS